MENLETKWYESLKKQTSEILVKNILPDSLENSITFDDLYVNQNLINDKKIGVGRFVPNSNNTIDTRFDFILSIDDRLVEINNNKVIILGSLGYGKTCLLNHIANAIIDNKISEKASENMLVKKFYNKFVILIRLKELKNEDYDLDCIESLIKNTIKKHLHSQYHDTIDSSFDKKIKDGVLLLLDGFDEINVDLQEKIFTNINNFCKDPKNTVFLTSREYAYNNSKLSFDDYYCVHLAPFNKTQIISFISQISDYYNEKYKTILNKSINPELIIKSLFKNLHLIELAKNPLFLTLLVLLCITKIYNNDEISYPFSRTELYEQIMELLLHRWKRVDDQINTRSILEEVAYRDINKNSIENSDVYAELCTVITKRMPNKIASEIIEEVADKTGIIINIGHDNYSFLHRSLQEYLAASYINENSDVIKFLKDSLSDFTRWKEVDIFLIGRKGLVKYYEAFGILFYLVPKDPKKDISILPNTLILAGISLVELLQIKSDCNFFNKEIITERIKKWILCYISNITIDYTYRAELGDILARLGDNRIGVGFITKDEIKIPDITWKKIPGGNCFLGSESSSVNTLKETTVGTFFISKYPITNLQYLCFIENDGYNIRDYWTKEGWEWVNGKNPSYFDDKEKGRYSAEREKQYQNWLIARNTNMRKKPFWWDEEPWNIPNRPVVGITWYEAVAYCNWLNSLYKNTDLINNEEYQSKEVRLPTIEEWEYAARGPKKYTYPWGNKLDDTCVKANFINSKLNQTCAVGIFSEGENEYGIYDMAGNVYEWIITGVIRKQDGNYSIDTEINLEKNTERMVTGGAWNFEYQRAECAFDEWDYPIIFDQNTGFRPIMIKI